MDKIVAILDYMCDVNNWCEPCDRVFYTWYLVLTITASYLMVGLYYYYPTALDMVFWPLALR